MNDARPRQLHVRLAAVLPEGWRDAAPWGYPRQVELALIAGVFRSQLKQSRVDELVDFVMRSRSHSLLDDLNEIVGAGEKGVVEALGPRWGDTNVLGVPVLRAAVIYNAAKALVDLGITSATDLQAATAERPAEVEKAVLGVRGIGPGTWGWISFLAHANVRPDAQVVAFIRESLEGDEKLSPEDAAELLRLTARRFASDERVLAHAVRAYLDDSEA